MAKLSDLINGQDVAFDTHQAGDGQKTNWKKVHLEKRLHDSKGKARFPLLGNDLPSNSGMNDKNFSRVTAEVKKSLKKNKGLLKELAATIVAELKRFSSGEATLEHAREAAKKFAGYFDLDIDFRDLVDEYADGHLTSVTTIHYNPEKKMLHEIHQSKDQIVIRKVRS